MKCSSSVLNLLAAAPDIAALSNKEGYPDVTFTMGSSSSESKTLLLY